MFFVSHPKKAVTRVSSIEDNMSSLFVWFGSSSQNYQYCCTHASFRLPLKPFFFLYCSWHFLSDSHSYSPFKLYRGPLHFLNRRELKYVEHDMTKWYVIDTRMTPTSYALPIVGVLSFLSPGFVRQVPHSLVKILSGAFLRKREAGLMKRDEEAARKSIAADPFVCESVTDV